MSVEESGSKCAVGEESEPHPSEVVRMPRGTKALAQRLEACEPFAERWEVPSKVDAHLGLDRNEEGSNREWACLEARLDRRICDLRHHLLHWPGRGAGICRSQAEDLDVGG